MLDKNDLYRIKKCLEYNVGKKIKVRSKRGRKKAIITHGVIENTYPNIFIVKLENDNEERNVAQRVSYSYTDVLTKTIELIMCKETPQVQLGS